MKARVILISVFLFALTLGLGSCEPSDPYETMKKEKNEKYKKRLKKAYKGGKKEFGSPEKEKAE